MKTICILTKPPIAGKTKKRLAAEIGEIPAAQIAKIMLNLLIRECKASVADKIYLYIPRESSRLDFEDIDLRDIKIRHQIGSNLGEKMANLFKNFHHNEVILIGSDCISHTFSNFNKVFYLLRKINLIIQPADDGGFILMGQSKFCHEVFVGVEWGTSTVFGKIHNILNDLDLKYYIMPKGFDIDIKEDLYKLHAINNQEIQKWLQIYSF
jgi:rSAM/selenodomain-associated transferase 1